ncbi:MAG: MFS transporter, partial [Nitrospinota bacterium]
MRPSRPAPASSFWRGDFPRVVGAYFSFFFSNSTFLLLPLYFDSLGAGESLIGALAAASNLATLFAMPGAGLCVRRWGGWSVLLWGLAAQAASALGFLLAPGSRFPLFALLRLVQGAAFALAFTGSVVVAAEAAPKGRRAQAFGLLGVV